MPKPNRAPRPITLTNQKLGLKSRYPDSQVTGGREELVWLGSVTPTEYSASYEVVISHNLRDSPLVYVARPHLTLVSGKGLPHVFMLNTLCLHTYSRSWIAAKLLADTLVPWAVEWLFFYEIWLATGGIWLGEGEHPTPLSDVPDRASAKRKSSQASSAKQKRLARLTTALESAYDQTASELDDLLHNSRL